MKIGIDTFSFHINQAAGDYDVFATLDLLEQWGLQGLQININGPNGRFLGGDPADRRHVQKVRRAIESRGFFVEVGGSGTCLERLEPQLRLAAALGADVLRTLLVFRESAAGTFERTRDEMQAVLPLARELGVRLAFENHEDVKAAELRTFLDGMEDPFVGACLDTGNDLVVYGDPMEAAVLLAPRAISTHIKDQKLIRVGEAVYSVGVPLGTGDLPLRNQLKEILGTGSLDRLLLQDTTGYSSRLNRFDRADLSPVSDYAGIPCFPDRDSAAAAGYLMGLEGLSVDRLREEAHRQHERIAEDIRNLRFWLEAAGKHDEGGSDRTDHDLYQSR
ncbi:MAG: TIM barrel protein [Opitutaceae bacterium]